MRRLAAFCNGGNLGDISKPLELDATKALVHLFMITYAFIYGYLG